MMLFEQIVGYSRYQRRKMRMERIEPHLRFCNLNCSSGLPDRVKDLCKSVIDKIGVQRNGSFDGNRCSVEIALANYVIRQFGVGFGKVRIELYGRARQRNGPIERSRT